MRNLVLLLTALAILIGINVTIYRRETLLSHGRTLLLELAPVDPRSFMQGDYMALRFQLENAAFPVDRQQTLGDGLLVLGVDRENRATYRRLADAAPLAGDEALLRYRIRNGRPKLATNAYFFQEGTGERYRTARYGEFRVAENGDAILVALRDEQLRTLGDRSTP